MRRFELVEGTSSKFWEVELAGCDVTVRYGRIGTDGQSKTKTFGSAAAAQKEHDALVKEKAGKGYGEVGVAETATLAAVVAPPQAASTSAGPKPAAIPDAAPVRAAAWATASVVPAPAPAATDAPPIEWPQGGFLWSDELRKAMPSVRGIHAPAPTDGMALLSQPIVFEDDKHGHRARGVGRRHECELDLLGRSDQRRDAPA